MFILITFLILVVTALTLLVLRITVPGFRYHWLFAVGGALLAWISAFLWLTRLPVSLQLPIWQPATVFSQSPAFIADNISWAFAISLLTLCLAIILTAVVRPKFPTPVNWVGTLVLTSLGVLAVVAGNPLTLVMIWAAIDLVELVVQLWFVEDPKLSERVVISFASPRDRDHDPALGGHGGRSRWTDGRLPGSDAAGRAVPPDRGRAAVGRAAPAPALYGRVFPAPRLWDRPAHGLCRLEPDPAGTHPGREHPLPFYSLPADAGLLRGGLRQLDVAAGAG